MYTTYFPRKEGSITINACYHLYRDCSRIKRSLKRCKSGKRKLLFFDSNSFLYNLLEPCLACDNRATRKEKSDA